MRRLAIAFLALLPLSAACIPETTPATPPTNAAQKPPTVEEAMKFLADVEVEFRKITVSQSRAGWVHENFITDDTEALNAEINDAAMEYLTRTIKAAERFKDLPLPEEAKRKLKLLKLSAGLPGPSDAKERTELAEIASWLDGEYGKGKWCPQGKPCVPIGDVSNLMASSRDYGELLEAWKGWHQVGKPMRAKYVRFVELGNKGARELGFDDMGKYWRAGYDMTPEQFEADTDRLWNAVKPLYDDLHCYARKQLRAKYGADKVAVHAPIPAHLLGNIWAQEWNNVYDLLEPYKGEAQLDATPNIKAKKLDAKQMVKIGEQFFVSLGFDPLPATFWERSLFTKPADREAVCHASAWDVTYSNDLRIKMCIEPKQEDLATIHHELGHDYYFHEYYKLPILFQSGANDGFHEGIGDTLILSMTPGYLRKLGLLDEAPDNPRAEMNFLLQRALEKVAFLPFGLLLDKWRWDVFAGKTPPAKYNAAWWELRRKYQGVAPAVARTEDDFDPGAKYHVASNTPYMRYFLAAIYQFQFHRALCKAAGFTGPLHKCSIYGNRAAGDKLKAMLALGQSKPWPEAMRALSGETQGDASAILDYFAPLQRWLKEQNKGEQCGW